MLRVASLLADELAAIQRWHGLRGAPDHHAGAAATAAAQCSGTTNLVFPKDASSRGQRAHVDGVVSDDSVARVGGWRQRPELLAPLHGPELRERLDDVSIEVRELATGSRVKIGMGHGDRGTIYKVNRRRRPPGRPAGVRRRGREAAAARRPDAAGRRDVGAGRRAGLL